MHDQPFTDGQLAQLREVVRQELAIYHPAGALPPFTKVFTDPGLLPLSLADALTDAHRAQLRLLIFETIQQQRTVGTILIDQATIGQLIAAADLLRTIANDAIAACAEQAAERKVHAAMGDQSGSPA